METPAEIAFTDMEPSEEIDALIREKIDHLEQFYGGITSCHVYVRAPHQSQRSGNRHEVTIEVRVPGDELVVRTQNDAPEHEHPRVAVRDAFSAMTRKLERWKERHRGEVKHHSGPLQGTIAEIDFNRGFGQIIATDHRLIYFHRNSVVDGNFDDLRRRDPVELVVQTGESGIGPQASTVRPIGAMEYDPGARSR